MKKTERYKYIKEILDKTYPEAGCTLRYEKPHELLIATILAAQCTDKRVNIITETLYKKYPDIKSFAEADYDELCEAVKTAGLYKSKAKNIIACAKKIMSDFGGEVPRTLDELTSLAGVGRKTAGVVLGDCFDTPSLVIDTHAKRLAKRMGFTKNTEPYKVEKDLAKFIPNEDKSKFCHELVLHGRAYCRARNPLCNECPVKEYCPYNK